MVDSKYGAGNEFKMGLEHLATPERLLTEYMSKGHRKQTEEASSG